MEFAKQQALTACGTCGHQEREHQGSTEDGEALDILAALGGPCTHYTLPAAAIAYQKHLAIANSGKGKPGPPCGRCGNRGHDKANCPL